MGDIEPTPVKRDRPVRTIKPPSQPVSELELLEFGDSSDDSDFHIEDLNEVSDDSLNSDDDNDGSSDDNDNDDSEINDIENGHDDTNDGHVKKSVTQLLERAKLQGSNLDLRNTTICCVCLGARSDADNEIVECDRCGVSVHECCYGVNDAASVSSTDSVTPTEPWFCEPCKEGAIDPVCELCPNPGGIFKATDVGRWVHLVCALYVPAIAFGEVERLANVTLFEMPYNKWGSKPCVLCPDERLARCGVQIACDAGMCKQYFHVTCGQREGLLSEAWSDEVDQADPFYAHCKLHTDKTVMHRRRTNYIILSVRQAQRQKELEAQLASPTPEALRIERKLKKKQAKYKLLRENANPPWVPTQKMPRLLNTSASACRALWRKAALMDIDVLAYESKATRDAVLHDIANKWHIPPAFSVEFTAYFLDRNSRIPTLKGKLQELLDRNSELSKAHEELELKYATVIQNKEEKEKVNSELKAVIETYHKLVKLVEPTKRLPIIQDIILHARATQGVGSPMMVPTAAALKAGVGYPILRTNYKGQQQTEPRIYPKLEPVQQPSPLPQGPVTCYECGICHGTKDQHLLTKCDACHIHYHLGCLTPPLTRMPKKTKQQGWECSECDREDTKTSDVKIEGPRRPRHKSPPTLPDAYYPKEKVERTSGGSGAGETGKRKHKSHGHGKKKKKLKEESSSSPVTSPVTLNSASMESMPHIRIKIKAVPSVDGLAKGTFVASSTEDDQPTPEVPAVAKIEPDQSPPRKTAAAKKLTSPTPTSARAKVKAEPAKTPEQKSPSGGKKKPAPPKTCDTCNESGDGTTLVRCDECFRSFHFGCLEPPLKKTPKVRGYSWHCAHCDPSDAEKK